MSILLGIDTGGTYTDAVLVEQKSGNVLAEAKALTTRDDLSRGITGAIDAVFKKMVTGTNPLGSEDVAMVGLSTTLATNAIAEGYGARVCLLLIGYDQDLMLRQGFNREIPTDDIVYIKGGHDLLGNEIMPLDIEAAKQAIVSRRDNVEAFAISGYFATRNTSHELKLRRLVHTLTDLPVTCGSDLTTRLNAVKRASTVVLNARLIPLLQELIRKVRHTLEELEITAPLMVVRGDGSLVKAEWAMQRPIETILSGPAASAVGAWHLSGSPHVWAVDMGGTTTDIVKLHDGKPSLNKEGAQIAGRRTMVEAVDVHTVGLGGDSHVSIGPDGQLILGPRRVLPLCLAAIEFPGIEEELRRQVSKKLQQEAIGQFAVPWRKPNCTIPSELLNLLDRIHAGPLPLCGGDIKEDWIILRRIERLEDLCLVQRAGFTPTDALHVLGRLHHWNTRTSRLGAELLGSRLKLGPEEFSELVVEKVSQRVAKEIVTKVLGDERSFPEWQNEPTATELLHRALGQKQGSELECELRLTQPIVAIGAPAKAYMPSVARMLRTELIIPPHAHVANAVGAIMGSVVQKVTVLITPIEGGSKFRLHMPDGIYDFDTLEESISYAEKVIPKHLESLAKDAGAEQIEITMSRNDRTTKTKLTWLQDIHLDTQISFTAVGRPISAKK